MSRYRIEFVVVFLVGLIAASWVAAGYVGSNALALAVTMLVAVCYVAGALELHRYQQATSTLAGAVADLSEPPPRLAVWLERLHPGLRSTVRMRIEGERAALPGPALTPYLVGLLVLLGMLGTLLGMVATLRGTGAALESATDLQAIRASLAAPVNGLGFSFGTSIAGVATSAMLGLLSALCRRERMLAAQALDAKIATTLRVYSQSQQREETFKLLQRQADMMPALVDRLQTMMTAIEQQSFALNQRLIDSQHAFHGKTEMAYARLASSVAMSLKESAAESARAAGAALQPAMQATMDGHAREMAALRETVEHAVQRQLDGLSTGFETTTSTVARLWSKALDDHQRSSEAVVQDLGTSLERFTETFGQRSTALLDGVSARLDATAGQVLAAWNEALTRQERASESIAERNKQALASAAATFEQHSAALLRSVDQSHADLQTELASRDAQRLEAWTASLGSVAATLSEEWEAAGERTASRQQDICDTLAQTARDIASQTQSHASATIAEISRLVQAASEAPKVAAEVVAELRQKLSDSMARDTAMLEERSRLLATVETLLGAVNLASTEQRTAIDALVATSADLLARVGTQFTDKVETETRKLSDNVETETRRFSDKVETETQKLGEVAAQVTGSAVEVASLGEAFGVAVQLFGESNDKLMAHLQRIEAALDKSLMRSDEQLAYYVAQAREVIDLSMLSQKQIVEDLQQLAGRKASAGAETA